MITQFALRLICGMSLMWCAIPRRDVTSGFFRIQMLVAMGLSVLAALTGWKWDLATAAPAALLAIFAYSGSIVWMLGWRRAGGAIIFATAILSTAMAVHTSLNILPPSESASAAASARPILIATADLASSLLLGGAVTGMLLGHWYLTAPTMSIAPLSRVNAYFALAGVARLIVSAIALTVGWNELSGATHLTWLLLRWCAGIVGPLLVAAMVWRILKYRNTQAATGVLFVGVILTFIGEMTAMLLLHETGIPY